MQPSLSWNAGGADKKGMVRLLCIALCACWLSGCFVFEELDSGMEIMEHHSKREKASDPAATSGGRRAKSEPDLLTRLQAAGGKVVDWWDDVRRPAPDPNDGVVRCRVGGTTQFTRQSECVARGGRVL